MANDPELDALTDGVQSPFWALYTDYVKREWGTQGQRFLTAVRTAAQSQEGLQELQKILYAQEAIAALMKWPQERLDQVRRRAVAEYQAAGGETSRRGPGL